MNNKEKFINILKTDPEVKKDMEELKMGCFIQYKVTEWYFRTVKFINRKIWTNKINVTHHYNYFNPVKIIEEQIINIIWTLEERHLRMFCVEIEFVCDTLVFQDIYWNQKIVGKLDNTKSFDNQSEEFYGKLVEFIEKAFNINK